MTLFSSKETHGPVPPLVEKQLLESIAASTGDAVIYYDTDFKVLFLNSTAEMLFGIYAPQIVGQRFTLEKAQQSPSKLLAHIMFPSLAPTLIRHSPEGQYPQVLELTVDEPHVELRLFLNRILDEQGRTAGFVKIVHDQTRERELVQSHYDFITVAAHQLRTPATAVNWVFENLSKNQALEKNTKDMIGVGHLAVKNLVKIIDDLLNISQIEEGRYGYNWQEVELVNFFNKLLADADAVAREYQVKLYLDRQSDQPLKISADIVKLSVAMSNLIDNAIKYNVVNGEVVVKVEKIGVNHQSFVQVSVKDTGIGIPPEQMKRLFGKFFRVPNMSKAAVEGSGLGLYITKNVIERHGGKIWAESVVNRGSTFYFTLPLLQK